ncbi:MAG: hypothetical protein PVJ67_01785 [Candidatus Pacearchaeota archaeon]|jgi:hypothetical protein
MYEYLKKLYRRIFPQEIELVNPEKVFIDIANGETTNQLTKKIRDGEFNFREFVFAEGFKWSGKKETIFLIKK